MLDPAVGELFGRIPSPQRDDLLAAFAAGGYDDRVEAVQAVLEACGAEWRDAAAGWIADLLSVERLVPESVARWRPMVRDAMKFTASHISDARLAPKIVQQVELPLGTSPEVRLGVLIAKTPGLQKLGQVIARVRRLSPELRHELQKLENGIRDVTAEDVKEIVSRRLGPALAAYQVQMAPELLSEASVSAIIEFTWMNFSTGHREAGVFKVIKPHVPVCYAEDLQLLQDLAEYLRTQAKRAYFVSREVTETLDDVRQLLESEVDFRREQATLAEIRRVYVREGVRTPKPIPELCTDDITAMSVERGTKVTEPFRLHPLQRRRVATQLVGFLVADPIFSEQPDAVFHADPHAGNLFYDETANEVIVLDWALTARLSREDRRQMGRLMMSMIFRDQTGVREAVLALCHNSGRANGSADAIIVREVDRFFGNLPLVVSLTTLDAMRLLETIGLAGVRFPASLVLIRKVLFTLDGVLHDIAGGEVRIDSVITREFFARCARPSLPAPFGIADYLAVQWSALRYASGIWSLQ